MTIEAQINNLSARLAKLRKKRQKRKPRPKSDRRQGRPAVPKEKIALAKELARTHPIADVAMILNLGKTTMFRHGITREKLDQEAARKKNLTAAAA